MNSMKKIIVSILAILLVVSVACTTYATEGDDINALLNELLQEENGNIAENEDAEEILEGTNNTNTQLNTNTNTNVNENRPATTPHAGLEDYTGLAFIGVFAVSAIYAYKKVKEYNA